MESTKITLRTDTGDHLLNVWLVTSPGEKQRGLMRVRSLPEGIDGMLFWFDEPERRSMWMHNTPMSLDMIFFDDDQYCVDVARETKPNTDDPVASTRECSWVLELPAGAAERMEIDEGDFFFKQEPTPVTIREPDSPRHEYRQ